MISTKYHSSFVLALKESLLKRMPYYEENETYILASILDPRFKLRWCQSDGDKLRCSIKVPIINQHFNN